LASLVMGKGAHNSWVDDISPRLERAVIGAEDQNFCRHDGFDFAAIQKAMDEHRRNPKKPLRGASTISQQTARTLFLGYSGGWIRKGVETYLTVLLEALWPKKRILTAYLNTVDRGDLPHRHRGGAAGRHPAQSAQMAGGPPRPLCRPPGRLAAGPQRHGGAG